MVRNEIIEEILKLDVSERRQIISAVTASLPEEIELQIPPEVQELIEQRREAYRRNPESFITLEEFKRMVQERRAKAKV